MMVDSRKILVFEEKITTFTSTVYLFCCFLITGRYITGVIPITKMFGFSRLLWLASRGTIFLRQVQIEEPMKDPTTVGGSGFYESLCMNLMNSRRVKEQTQLQLVALAFMRHIA